MAFSHLLPVEDLGLPVGYKSSKESVRESVRLVEESKNKVRENDYSRRLIKKEIWSDPYEKSKFENYFGEPKKFKKG